MSLPAPDYKAYPSAHKRFLEATVAHFFEEHFPSLFGPAMRARIATHLLERLDAQLLPVAQLRPGQCLWNAVAIDTRADSRRLRLVPVILTLVSDEDITQLAAGASLAQVGQGAVARVLEEAYEQGALLSMRDLGLLTWRRGHQLTQYRRAWEAEHGSLLPHPGTLQDMGSCLTHKTSIIVKVVYEHRDPRQVATEVRHSQHAVDRYLKDFHRVRTCYRQRPELDFICQATGMARHLVRQYLAIIQQHEDPVLTGNSA